MTPAQLGKTERLQNCRATPQAPAPLKKRKQTLMKQTTINCSLKTTQRTRVKHRGREIIPHANMCRQKASSKLGRPTPRDLKLTRISHTGSTSMSYPLTGWRQLTIYIYSCLQQQDVSTASSKMPAARYQHCQQQMSALSECINQCSVINQLSALIN